MAFPEGVKGTGKPFSDPSRWRIEFCDPIDLSEHPPEAAEDRQLVFDLSEQVRDVIQHKLYENLVLRGSAFL
jgi:hypothetical protein